ncbi:cysteine protease rdl2-related [Anaeramoeba ignava]|uniref:Cysteine protease rdl2-related n=1 Tax=Anaeramoeba ignava TaxID=1746090 RepID=A0A9Q0M008_ANAIG|nr:cysteine protease rdl2-related [Anaeramoeba ignava]
MKFLFLFLFFLIVTIVISQDQLPKQQRKEIGKTFEREKLEFRKFEEFEKQELRKRTGKKFEEQERRRFRRRNPERNDEEKGFGKGFGRELKSFNEDEEECPFYGGKKQRRGFKENQENGFGNGFGKGFGRRFKDFDDSENFPKMRSQYAPRFGMLHSQEPLTEVIIKNLFQRFMTVFKKDYLEDEYEHRYQIFKENVLRIKESNENPEIKHKLSINKFADLTNAEYQSLYLKPIKISETNKIGVYKNTNKPKDAIVDWRKEGVVTPVKNEGSECSMSLALSIAGSVESYHAIKVGELTALSEQELIDCVLGCFGGTFAEGFEFVETNGLCSAGDYPVTNQKGTCKNGSCQAVTKIGGYVQITEGDENSMANACAQYGPLSAAIDASHFSFQVYTGGVYYEADCSSTELDHAVVVVGYGVDQDQNYWIVKNSWGVDWGLDGYIWMSKDRNNNCGIASSTFYVTGV